MHLLWGQEMMAGKAIVPRTSVPKDLSFVRQGSQGIMSVAEGARHCPRVMVGESGLKMR